MYINFENVLILIICYFIGSIPFGLLISLFLNKNDPRLVGSKNIGATNIARASGWKLGFLTLICDILKGYMPLIFFKGHALSFELMILSIFVGHLFPIWIKFKGGKGIAVIIGCLLGYNVIYGLTFLFIWLVVALMSKYSSLSALIASSSVLIIIFLKNDPLITVMSIMVSMIFFKHFSNIERLIKGEESKIKLKK